MQRNSGAGVGDRVGLVVIVVIADGFEVVVDGVGVVGVVGVVGFISSIQHPSALQYWRHNGKSRSLNNKATATDMIGTASPVGISNVNVSLVIDVVHLETVALAITASLLPLLVERSRNGVFEEALDQTWIATPILCVITSGTQTLTAMQSHISL